MNYTEQALGTFEANSTSSAVSISAVALLALMLSYQVPVPIDAIEGFSTTPQKSAEETYSLADRSYQISEQEILSQIDALYGHLQEKSEPLDANFRVESYSDMWSMYG